jgi:hypothetical protein
MEKKTQAYKRRQKELILRALTEPVFRRMLVTDPAKALGRGRISPEMKKEVSMVLAIVKGIDSQISALADELLCANGGGCGIA